MRRKRTLMVALAAAAVIAVCGCLASHKTAPAARDSDARTIGADVGAAKGNATTQPVGGSAATGQVGGINLAADPVSAKGNATTQPVTGENATGQVGGVNTALNYGSSLGIGAVAIVILLGGTVLIVSHKGRTNDNEVDKVGITSHEKVQLAHIEATRQIATDAIRLAMEVIRGKAA